ncbi:hypothetical protein SAMN05216288_0751 [Pseudomonas punonensis]|uniref:Uncharacterized protein n=1 Tax=Phytopseudomonas punonensis TaxID=1220495 RepID=A0A1M6WW69_9GAMM|nr:hypothetical protein SAMN05216288_0751 [Pseudomonas punonensis]
MLIYTSKVVRDSDRFLAFLCLALAAAPTFFSGLLSLCSSFIHPAGRTLRPAS